MGDGAIAAVRVDPERIRQLGIELQLSVRELCWFMCITEVAYYRWSRNGTGALVSGTSVLLDLAEQAITSRRLKIRRLHRFMGLRRGRRNEVIRPAEEPRDDDRRTKSWAYVARCAYTDTELLQITHPGLMEGRKVPIKHQETGAEDG